VIADNQKTIAEFLERYSVIKLLNEMEQLPELIKTAENWMQPVSQTASEICDGSGTMLELVAVHSASVAQLLP
jgi:hypothetical protein